MGADAPIPPWGLLPPHPFGRPAAAFITGFTNQRLPAVLREGARIGGA